MVESVIAFFTRSFIGLPANGSLTISGFLCSTLLSPERDLMTGKTCFSPVARRASHSYSAPALFDNGVLLVAESSRFANRRMDTRQEKKEKPGKL